MKLDCKAAKMPKNGFKKKKCKNNSWCRQQYTAVWFSIAFLCSILNPSTENIKKKHLGQNCLKNVTSDFWKKYPNCALHEKLFFFNAY